MANFKHKVFLLIAEWIPVAVAAGILINNTLAILDAKDVILDLADFGLYKSQRDGFDVTNARVSELEKEVAVLRATRPYQDALIQAAITRVAEQADFNLFRRTCRMITGEVVLPNTPTVTGYPAYNPYSCPAQSAPAPAN